MPDQPTAPTVNKDFDAILKALAANDRGGAPQPADDRLRDEAFRKPPVFTRMTPCATCHSKPEDKGFKLSLTPIAGYDDLATFTRPRAVVAETPEAAEKRIVDKFNRQPIIDQAATILNRLPEKIDITVDKDKISVATNFVKAIEAIPGVKLDKDMRDYLSKLQTVSFENGKYALKLDKPIDFGIGKIGTDISFDVKNDPSKPDGVGLTSVKGLTVLGIEIDELTVRSDNGKNMVAVGGNLFGRRINKEIDLNKFNANGEHLKMAIGQLAEYKPMIQNRDFGKFTNEVPEGFRNTVTEMLKGVSSISKDGDKYTIKRTNGMTSFDFGGPSLTLSPEVSFKFGTNSDSPSIRDVHGINFSMPIPEKLELGSKFSTGIKGISLGLTDRDGGRSIRVDTNHLIDSVQVNLDPNFKPRTDADGNWNINLRGSNPLSENRHDKANINIRLGSDGNVNMKPSEILDIVSRLTWQASDVSITGGSMAVAATYSKVASWISSLFE